MKKRWIPWAFMAPALIILTVFMLIPLIASFVMSFGNVTVFLDTFSFAGIGNYFRAFSDQRVLNALKNTIVFTVVSVPLQMCFSLLLASLVSRDTRFFRACRSFYFIPTLCSFTAIGILFIMLLDRTSGILPYWLKQIGIRKPSMLAKPDSAMFWLILITLWRNFGTSMVILVAGIQNIPKNLYEAAEIDGANAVQRFFRITIPQLTSSLGFCVITETIGCLQLFDQPYVITKGGPFFGTESIVQYIYTVAFKSFDLSYASAIAVILFLIIMVTVSLFQRQITRREAETY